MRDLARSGTFGNRRFNKKVLFIVLGIILISGAFLSFIGTNSGSSSRDGSVVLSDAPPDMKPVVLSSESGVASGGVDLKTETAKLKDLRGGASAVVSRSYGGGVYKLDVSATLPDPKNVSYALWLVGGEGPILIDYMRGSGTSWSLGLSGPDRYSDLDGVIISLERTKDENVEEKVMEGTF